jgi:hypothetical protein
MDFESGDSRDVDDRDSHLRHVWEFPLPSVRSDERLAEVEPPVETRSRPLAAVITISRDGKRRAQSLSGL